MLRIRRKCVVLGIMLGVCGCLVAQPLSAQPPPGTATPVPTIGTADPDPTPGAIPYYLPLIDRNAPHGTPVFLPLIDRSQATPTPSTPMATVQYARINLRFWPSNQSPVRSQVQLATVCTVAGRNAATSWLLLSCPENRRGWVDVRLVDVSGALLQAPLLGFDVGATTPTVSPPSTFSTPLPTLTSPAAVTPTATPTPSLWRAEFFDDPYLIAPPLFTRFVPEINFDWQLAAPAPQLPDDRFSIRFTRAVTLPSGYYRFTARADDGVRFWLDDELLIDGWLGARDETFSITRLLAGAHELRVEYYEDRIAAAVRFTMQPQPNSADWTASYFAGTELTGPPLLRRTEPRGLHPLDYAWGRSSPAPNDVPADRWSARWQGRFHFDGGNYQFTSDAQDGVRVYIDNLLVLDDWRNGRSRVQNRVIGIGPGLHDVTVEYYNRTGDARLDIWWLRDSRQQIAP